MAATTSKKGATARSNAVRKLIAAHQQEFDGILNEERAAVGLPVQVSEAERVQKRITELQAKLDKLTATQGPATPAEGITDWPADQPKG